MIVRVIASLGLAISTGVLVILTNLSSSAELSGRENPVVTAPAIHPLPPTLVQWQNNSNSGDYFDQVQPTQAGYLIWSRFPVKVYVETPRVVSSQQANSWFNSVSQIVEEWNQYLPLELVLQPEAADIRIWRKQPPLQGNPPRARSAETRYTLYEKQTILYHKITILLSPSQTGKYLQAAARHELGHALGIWGHSPLQTDALYFAQVRNPPPISARDVNTLKRVYQQPTSLGFKKP
ncbi:MAG: peptidase [Nostocaceae cyanobacterium]|nr:peptidase [Nostocaceae cyanobacterium]